MGTEVTGSTSSRQNRLGEKDSPSLVRAAPPTQDRGARITARPRRRPRVGGQGVDEGDGRGAGISVGTGVVGFSVGEGAGVGAPGPATK
ncbi:hypothetical protein MTE01_15890 [Microbacterium testaceum]|uniref:Uncharacterized protein n=1 Tax=Microbacterium testaceum TaxID=2033 RepID=A0A4Y3QK44_MICTE|nr:hypothetical protein MTE01_15890 [Microbacterium testaceum]